MTRTYTFAQTLVQISGLTRAQLDALIAAEAVVPKATDAGPAFDEADLARLDLLCGFSEVYRMEADALALVISVIDQMHAARLQRQALLTAIRAQPAPVREAIAATLGELL